MEYLKDYIGQELLAFVPIINREAIQTLLLHGIEDAGIWVESENLTQMVLAKLNRPASSRTPIFFLPFSQIGFVLSGIGKVSLSHKAFGV